MIFKYLGTAVVAIAALSFVTTVDARGTTSGITIRR
jgi:hypothetical protein